MNIRFDLMGLQMAAVMLLGGVTAFLAPAQADDADAVELCGAGWIKAPAARPTEAEEPTFEAAVMETLGHTLSASRTHADIVARLRASHREPALATLSIIEMVGLDRPLVLPFQEPDPSSGRDALARRALTTTDPTVYALAFQTCRDAEGPCRQLDAARWARLDPGNAAPWMTMLDAAAKAKDGAAVDEALHRIGVSERSTEAMFATSAEVLRVAPDDDASLLEVDRIVTGLVGVSAAFAMPGYRVVMDACKRDALRDANRKQTCEAVATVLTQRSDTILEQTIGAGIGRNLGWPQERFAPLRREQEAYAQSRREETPDGRFDCASIRRRLDTMRGVSTLGEVGAMHAWYAKSGRTDAATPYSATPPLPR